MYKLIIIDDEDIIRNGLVDLIPWGNLGFEVAAVFEDGQEAIDYIKRHPVDAVLTDIIMADVGGIQLAKFIYQEFSKVKVVLLSGYKEFEYAQQAIQYNVTHYLLKPTKLEEIVNVFKTIKVELDDKHKSEAEAKRAQELLPILQEQFFIDLLMGALRDTTEMKRRMQMIALPFESSDSCCVIDIQLQPDGQSRTFEERNKIFLGLSRSFKGQDKDKHQLQVYPIVHHHFQGFKAVAVFANKLDADAGIKLVHDMLEKLSSSAKAVFDTVVAATIETVYSSVDDLAVSSEVLRLIRQESSGKLRFANMEYDKITSKYKLFISNIIEGNSSEVSSLFDRFLEEFREAPDSFTHRLIKDLFAIIQQTFEQGGVDVKELTRTVLDHDMETSRIEEIRDMSKHMLTKVMNDTSPYKNHSSSVLIDKAKLYMQENYAQELSLESVADLVFLHPVYLSKLFKQYVGINYTDYLTQIRIQKALELIGERKYKMYEVGEMVGYSNSKYFYRVFKQVTGHTPKEYCRIHL